MSAAEGPLRQPGLPERLNAAPKKPKSKTTKASADANAPAPSQVPQASTKYQNDPQALARLQGHNGFVNVQPTEENSFVNAEGKPLNEDADDDAMDESKDGADADEERRQEELGQQEMRAPVPEEIVKIYHAIGVCEAFQKLWLSADDAEAQEYLFKANREIQKINETNNWEKDGNLIPIASIWGEMETAKTYARMLEQDALARVSNEPGAPLCREAIESQMTTLTAKFRLLEIPIEKYIHKEAAMIMEENARDREEAIKAITQVFEAEVNRKPTEQSLTLSKAYAEAGKIIPSMWVDQGDNEKLQQLSIINDRLSAENYGNRQLIPIEQLQKVIQSVATQRGLGKEPTVEMMAFARCLLQEGFPVYDWMPERVHSDVPRLSALPVPVAPAVTPAAAPVAPAVASAAVPVAPAVPAVPPTPTDVPVVPMDVDTHLQELSDSSNYVIINDDSDGLTIYGKVVHVIKYGWGTRVFVNFGTDKRPVYDVYPGSVFDVGCAEEWLKKMKLDPMWGEWKKDQNVAAVHDMMYANGDHTYFLVARGNRREGLAGGKSMIAPTGDKYFCSKTQLQKLMNKAKFEDTVQKITVQSEKNYEYSQHCQKNDLNPDTGNPLTENEKELMPWLAAKNYNQDRRVFYRSEPAKRERKKKSVQTLPALETPNTSTLLTTPVEVPAAPLATLDPAAAPVAPAVASAAVPVAPAITPAAAPPVTLAVAPAAAPVAPAVTPAAAPVAPAVTLAPAPLPVAPAVPAAAAPVAPAVTPAAAPPVAPAVTPAAAPPVTLAVAPAAAGVAPAVTPAAGVAPVTAMTPAAAQLSPEQLMSMFQTMVQNMPPDTRSAVLQSMATGPA